MLLGLMSVSTFATEGDVAASVDVKINDINGNVVNITASAEKGAIVALASYQDGKKSHKEKKFILRGNK